MKIFITGSVGKLGKIICEKLIGEGRSVIGFDLMPSNFHHDRYYHVIGDLKDKSQLMSALNGCRCIIHSAVYKGDYNHDLKPAFESNILGTINLYECALSLNKIKVVLLSSAPVDKEVLGGGPFDWKSHSGSDHMYDLTKRLQEEIAYDYSETFKLQTIILRLGHIVNGQTNTDLAGKSLVDLKYCLGGWVDIYDVAEACLLATKHQGNNSQVFNIIGSYTKEDLFATSLTVEELGWEPIYSFKDL